MTTAELRDFKKRTVNDYVVETSNLYTRKGKTIPEGMYSLFGKYCDLNTSDTREKVVTWANERREEVNEAGTVTRYTIIKTTHGGASQQPTGETL